eukprot:TRINITY_DN3786_c0_g1_i8.p1 TRINITY_DN3786_c0_g1~~TRINITY_DN3786_c0_g1_i8.p1  ORF type:complete len:512 (+),score=150.20 TRINITY_DN3786_c0_g1_i8:56-1591(+)
MADDEAPECWETHYEEAPCPPPRSPERWVEATFGSVTDAWQDNSDWHDQAQDSWDEMSVEVFRQLFEGKLDTGFEYEPLVFGLIRDSDAIDDDGDAIEDDGDAIEDDGDVIEGDGDVIDDDGDVIDDDGDAIDNDGDAIDRDLVKEFGKIQFGGESEDLSNEHRLNTHLQQENLSDEKGTEEAVADSWDAWDAQQDSDLQTIHGDDETNATDSEEEFVAVSKEMDTVGTNPEVEKKLQSFDPKIAEVVLPLETLDVVSQLKHDDVVNEADLAPISRERPLLVIDWTKASNGYLFRGDNSYASEMLLQMMMKDFEANWEERLETWFENRIAFHSTEFRCIPLIAALEKQYKSSRRPLIARYAYPAKGKERPTRECFQVIRRPTKWLCVNEIKLALDDCHRLPAWKAAMAEELYILANELSIQTTKAPFQLLPQESGGQDHQQSSQADSDDEDVPEWLKETETKDEEDLQVIDQILAMILIRSEFASFSQPLLEHAQTQHARLRSLWSRQFQG